MANLLVTLSRYLAIGHQATHNLNQHTASRKAMANLNPFTLNQHTLNPKLHTASLAMAARKDTLPGNTKTSSQLTKATLRLPDQ